MDKVAEMVGSAVVQEVVSRAFSFLLGKREEKASQAGHLMERLQMAAVKMELALERSKKLPILDVSLLTRRKMIKCVYIEAMDLLDKNKQQAVPAGREQIAPQQGVKRKWSCIIITDANKNNLPVSSSGGLNNDSIKRFERVGLFASEFVRDLETGCSLSHYNFCNPIVRLLLEGKTYLSCEQMQGNQLHYVRIFRACFDEERGVEALLAYSSMDTTIMEEKSFYMELVLRLSERTDIAGVSIKACQLLTSQLKLVADDALILLPTLLHDINAYLHVPCWDFDHDFKSVFIKSAQADRQDPSCCGARRNGMRSNNGVSSELSHMFQEEVIRFCFAATGSSRIRSSSNEAAGSRSIHSRGWTPPLVLAALFAPHCTNTWVSQGTEITVLAGNNVEEERDNASIQQVSEALESDAVSCFSRQPEATEYVVLWRSKHGGACFLVRKPRIIQRRRSRYNTRASTKRRSARS